VYANTQIWTAQFDEAAAYGVGTKNGYVYVAGTEYVARLSPDVTSLPIVGDIITTLDPILVGTNISTSSTFADMGINDTHTAEWEWGDGSTSLGVVNEYVGSGTVDGYHTYNTPGIYTITLTVTDNYNDIGKMTYEPIIVYYPSDSSARGSGTFLSPLGALISSPQATGTARFGFRSKYQKGAIVPTGGTRFSFRVADFSFASTNYDWLVVAGSKTHYVGTGEVNHQGDYAFLLVATDGNIPGGGGVDKLRLKIWDKNTQGIIYDNQFGAPNYQDPTTSLQSGKITIVN